jgi:uncharacterized protein YgbK (DUF1537 family)
VAFFVLSDDLTGAAGVASMVDRPKTVAVNLDRFDRGLAGEFACIAVNLEIRERSEEEAARRLALALEVVGEGQVAVRIDSALRGHVGMLIAAMAERGDVLVTDTLPEYGRRTLSGRTLIGSQERDMEPILAPLRRQKMDRRIEVADSETYEDLDALACRCVEDGMIPADPGPLVARVARAKIPLVLGRPAAIGARRVAFVVGTRDPKTLRQIRHMEELGVPVQKPRIKPTEEVDIFAFSVEKDGALVTRDFLQHLAGYDALVLSGGATANYILARSGFRYLVSEEQVQPLVSSASVKGGLFDGKRVVLKGGFIGDDYTYKRILDWLRKT